MSKAAGPGVRSSSLIPHPSSLQFKALPPLSLYIHIPWCARKCPYCDFNSHEARAPVPEERYVAALVADLEQALPRVWGRRVSSVFFGGGTPSLFSARAIEAILAAARARLPLVAVVRELDEAERRGLIARDHARISPSPLGRRFLNDLLQIFLRPDKTDSVLNRAGAFL